MQRKMTTEQRRRRRFSESFRKEQVALIESGQVTIAEVSRRYEVLANNVSKWVKKYGKSREESGLTIIGSSDDFDRLREVERSYRDLQVLFGEQQVKLVRLEKLLDLAKDELGSDFEKKCNSHY